MIIFAAGLGGFIELILLLIVAGAWLIRKLAGAAERQQEPRARLPQPAQRPRANVNPMDPRDIDEFLGEIVGDDRVLGPAVLRPPGTPSPAPVVLRPGGSTPRPQRPPQPVRRKPRVERGRRPEPGRPGSLSRATESAKHAVQQAADATDRAGAASHEAAELGVQAAQPVAARNSLVLDIRRLLHSPADLRRAILIQEILSPPLALRRPRRERTIE